MPVEEPRGWKRTLEEDLYFHKLDAELIDRLRRRRVLETERRLLARASGTNDQAILKDLEGLGFNRDTVILLHLAPLVHVAWISGSVTDAQRERIFEIARLRGVTEGTPAHQRLSEWLGRRPSEEFFQTSLHAIRRVLQVLRPQERKIKKRNLIQYSIDIASASSSLFSLGRKVSAAERKLIRRIAAELEKENGAAARQVLEDARIAEEPPHQSLAFFQRILVVVEAEERRRRRSNALSSWPRATTRKSPWPECTGHWRLAPRTRRWRKRCAHGWKPWPDTPGRKPSWPNAGCCREFRTSKSSARSYAAVSTW